MRTAVLLAAGRGTRLKPHTDTTPKSLLPINGAPTLDLYFQALHNAEVEHAVLVVHHLADQIDQYAQEAQMRFQIQCSVVYQEVLDGTASALEVAKEAAHVDSFGNNSISSFLLMATDYLIPPNFFEELLSFHKSHDAQVSVSLKRVPADELCSRSSVRFDMDGNLTEIVEKPALGQAPSEFGANLAFVLPQQIFEYLPKVKTSVRGEREVQSAINFYLAERGSARGLLQQTPQEWTPESS